MKLIQATKSIGSGESRCRTSREVRQDLNNTQITPGEALRFAAKVYPGRHFRVTFSNRKTRHRWGTAWPKQGRMVLYRHSVQVFLHELAHLAVDPCAWHNQEFALELDRLIEAWIGRDDQ